MASMRRSLSFGRRRKAKDDPELLLAEQQRRRVQSCSATGAGARHSAMGSRSWAPPWSRRTRYKRMSAVDSSAAFDGVDPMLESHWSWYGKEHDTRRSLKEILGEYVDLQSYQATGLTYGEFCKLLQQFLNADIGETLTRSLFDSFRDAPSGGCMTTSPSLGEVGRAGSRLRVQASATSMSGGKASEGDSVSSSSSLNRTATAAAVNIVGTTGAFLATASSASDTDSKLSADVTDGPDSKTDPAAAANGGVVGSAENDGAQSATPSAAEAGEKRACLSDIMCYLSLLEQGNPQSKLEFMFKLYDVDNSGFLENAEIHRIMSQMLTVAEYLGWDTSELRPILVEMLRDIDSDSDGRISLEEWIAGGLHTIPLLVLLGLETKMKDGIHQWHLKQFNHPAYCNICRRMLLGLIKQGLVCSFCHYTVHERCVRDVKEACISTYMKTGKRDQPMPHHWVEGNNQGKCEKCGKAVKAVNGLTGVKCTWCHKLYHNMCASFAPDHCTLGDARSHILPPVSIQPAVLQSSSSTHHSSVSTPTSTSFSFGSLDMTVSPLPNTHPLLVFVNPKSGGKQGARLISKFQYLLNPRQVYDLSNGGPKAGLQFFSSVEFGRILCCGGDGTVGWVLATIDEMKLPYRLPVAVLPLGTGNDLSRCLGWGGGYEGEDLTKMFRRLADASLVNMDRWKVSVENIVCQVADVDTESKGDPMPLDIINNYFSIGVDASIARKFHNMRETCPQKFNSRTRNKMWYLEFGAGEMFSASCKNLIGNMTLKVDGKVVDLSHTSLEGIAVLNIPSMYGGSNLWGTDDSKPRKRTWSSARAASVDTGVVSQDPGEFQTQDVSDRLLEVVGLENSFYVGQIKAGLRHRGQRLAQGREITIETTRRFPMQVDGEPWLQVPCKLTISHHNQVPMLHAPQQLQKRLSSLLFRSRPSGAISTTV